MGPIHKGGEQPVEVEVPRHEDLGHVAAPETEVAEDVLRQGLHLLVGLAAVEHGDGSALAPDDVGDLAEVMLEVPAAVSAAGGDHGVEAVQPLHDFDLLADAGAGGGPSLDQGLGQPGIVPAGLDPDPVARHHRTEQIMHSNEGNVAGEHEAHRDRLGLPFRHRKPLQPGLDGRVLQGRAPGLGGVPHLGRRKPAVGVLGGGHGRVERGPGCRGRVAQRFEPPLAEGGEHGAGAVEVDGSVGNHVHHALQGAKMAATS